MLGLAVQSRTKTELTFMKAVLLLTAIVAAIAGISVPARAEIVPATPFFLDLGAEGFGDAHRLLTLQSTPQEIGGTVVGAGGTTILTGQAVPGADKSAVANAGALGWNTGANVGLGLNVDFSGDTVGMNLNSVVLTLATSSGAVIQNFPLASGFNIPRAVLDLQQGNGNAVFNFVLTAAEQAQWTADVIANGGAAALFVALSSDMGCASGGLGCSSNDGPDSWLAFNQTAATATPLPAALWMFGGGLALFGLLGRWFRRRDRGPVSLLATA